MKTLTVNGEQHEVKEMSDWTGDFTEQFKPGDLVTEEIAWYFLEVLPPHTQSFGYFQVGEPHSHINAGRHGQRSRRSRMIQKYGNGVVFASQVRGMTIEV